MRKSNKQRQRRKKQLVEASRLKSREIGSNAKSVVGTSGIVLFPLVHWNDHGLVWIKTARSVSWPAVLIGQFIVALHIRARFGPRERIEREFRNFLAEPRGPLRAN